MMYKFLKFIWYRFIPIELFSKIQFKRFWKYSMNLNNPRTLGEKLQWIKLRADEFIETKFVDKYEVRKYVESKVGKKYLIPLLYTTENASDLVADILPDAPFIIKTNHDSGIGFIFNSKDDHNLIDVRNSLRKRLNINHYYHTKEYPYKKVKPRILIERLLLNKNNQIPNDIKIHCFNGEPILIYCSLDRMGEDFRVIMDKDFNPLKMSWGKDPSKFKYKKIEKPQRLEEMLQIARKLAKEHPIVRIDLYDQDDQIYFGEMTFFQGSGFDPVFPKEMDEYLGSLLDISNIKAKI